MLRIRFPAQGDHGVGGGDERNVLGHDDLAALKPRGLDLRRGVVAEDFLRAGEEFIVGEERERAADGLAEGGLVEPAAVFAVERGGRNAALRHEEVGARGEHVTLWRRARVGCLAAGVVAPEQPAVAGLCRFEIDALGRKNSRAVVGHAVVHQHAGSHGPHRNHPAVAKQTLVARSCASLPDDLAVRRGEAVNETVVGADINPVVTDRRREPHRAAGEERPADAAGRRVERIDLVVGG